MKPRTYPVLARCVEEGVAYGWKRAHKHSDHPSAEIILTEIESAVLNEICDYFGPFNEDPQ